MGFRALHIDETMHDTGHVCTDSDCGAAVAVTEVVMLVQIVLPQISEQQQVELKPFEGPDGAFAYEPYFFHDGCWANTADSLSELLEEYNCVPEQDPHSFSTCGACGQGIRVGEPMALIQMGEFQAADRQPEGYAHKFQPYDQTPDMYCLSCIRSVNDDIIELWETISFAGECAACTYQRNWRNNAQCNHEEETDEF